MSDLPIESFYSQVSLWNFLTEFWCVRYLKYPLWIWYISLPLVHIRMWPSIFVIVILNTFYEWVCWCNKLSFHLIWNQNNAVIIKSSNISIIRNLILFVSWKAGTYALCIACNHPILIICGNKIETLMLLQCLFSFIRF